MYANLGFKKVKFQKWSQYYSNLLPQLRTESCTQKYPVSDRIIHVTTVSGKSGIQLDFFNYPANPVFGRITKTTIWCTPIFMCVE